MPDDLNQYINEQLVEIEYKLKRMKSFIIPLGCFSLFVPIIFAMLSLLNFAEMDMLWANSSAIVLVLLTLAIIAFIQCWKMSQLERKRGYYQAFLILVPEVSLEE